MKNVKLEKRRQALLRIYSPSQSNLDTIIYFGYHAVTLHDGRKITNVYNANYRRFFYQGILSISCDICNRGQTGRQNHLSKAYM